MRRRFLVYATLGQPLVVKFAEGRRALAPGLRSDRLAPALGWVDALRHAAQQFLCLGARGGDGVKFALADHIGPLALAECVFDDPEPRSARADPEREARNLDVAVVGVHAA